MKTLKAMTDEELRDELVRLSLEHRRVASAALANRLFDKRVKVHRNFRKRGPRSIRILEPLLSSDAAEIRLAAAYVCLETNPEASLKVLCSLLNDTNFFIKAEASGILDSWNRKILTFPDPEGKGFSKLPSQP